MKEDLIKLIKAFDRYLDDMYDSGSFDPTNPADKELDDFIREMKNKYNVS